MTFTSDPDKQRAAAQAAASALQALGALVEPETAAEAETRKSEKERAEARETAGHYIRALSLSLAGIMGIAASFVVAVVTSVDDKLAIADVAARTLEVRLSGELFTWLSLLLLVGVAAALLLQYVQYKVHRKMHHKLGVILASGAFAIVVLFSYLSAEVGVCGGHALLHYDAKTTPTDRPSAWVLKVFACEDELERWKPESGWPIKAALPYSRVSGTS